MITTPFGPADEMVVKESMFAKSKISLLRFVFFCIFCRRVGFLGG